MKKRRCNDYCILKSFVILATAGAIGLPLLQGCWLWPAHPAVAGAPAGGLSSLKNNCKVMDASGLAANPPLLPYRFCDDGLPPIGIGGRIPNLGPQNAVAVPEKYQGDKGLPQKALPPDPDSGSDNNGDIALDVDVSLPPDTMAPPPGGYPLIVMMHGCCWATKRRGRPRATSR